jgi:predicted RNA-binding protein YlqC (UPF0109 family)
VTLDPDGGPEAVGEVAGVAEATDDTVDEGDTGNRLEGATPRAVLDYVARAIVDEPDAVVIETDEGRRTLTLRLHVAPGDMGKVIGKRGRVAQAIRTIVRAAGARDEMTVDVDIVD